MKKHIQAFLGSGVLSAGSIKWPVRGTVNTFRKIIPAPTTDDPLATFHGMSSWDCELTVEPAASLPSGLVADLDFVSEDDVRLTGRVLLTNVIGSNLTFKGTGPINLSRL